MSTKSDIVWDLITCLIFLSMNFKKGDQLRYYQDLKTTTFSVENHRFGITMQHAIYMSGFSIFTFVRFFFLNSEDRITLETSQSQPVTPFPLLQSLLLYFLLNCILFLSRHKKRQHHVHNKTDHHHTGY